MSDLRAWLDLSQAADARCCVLCSTSAVKGLWALGFAAMAELDAVGSQLNVVLSKMRNVSRTQD